ncbi:MAG TPA: lysylphosphatidylglycerol synthase transmembrane domain-containing protein [Gaiellaceae bacterium]|nr:lysylphosphatidylglycerol synthase transmembrane domain-containing protein [Gaiellaceae bacterium]
MRVALARNAWLRVVLVAVVVAAVVALVVWRGPRLDLLRDAFTLVRWDWVGLAFVLNLVSVAVRTLAWRTVIRQAMQPPHPRLRAIFSAFCVGLLANAVLPGRIGELARVAVLTRHLPTRRGEWATLAGTVFAHRVFDLAAALVLVGWVLWVATVPAWALTSLTILVVIGVSLLVLGILGARDPSRGIRQELGAARRLVSMARNGLGVMREPLPAAVAILFQCAGWGLQLLAVYAAMRAFNIEEPLAAAGLVLVMMNVAMVFPLWPGNVGLVQAAVALSLLSYGIDYAHGFAFGIGLQAIEASVGIGLGLAYTAREGLTLGTLRQFERPGAAPPA